jgi:hypothetical protein
MSPAIFQSDITNALDKADYLVWTYSDVNDYLTPGGVDPSWIAAISNARAAAGSPTPTPIPTPRQHHHHYQQVTAGYITQERN